MFQEEWYQHFFQGIAGEFWDYLAAGEYTEVEGKFIAQTLDLSEGANVLDAPSGSGRVSLWLEEVKKWRMTGLDINPESVAKFNEQAAEKGLVGKAQVADLSQFKNAIGCFDAALCLGNCFGYFHETGMRNFVRTVSNALVPGGVWMIQSGMLAESIFPNWMNDDFFEINEFTMEVRNTYDSYESKMLIEATFSTPEGQREKKNFQHYIYTLKEIRQMLEKEGLEITDMYGGTDGRTFALGDEQIYIVARKTNDLKKEYP